MSESTHVKREYFRACILYEFRLGTSAAEIHHRLCATFGSTVISKTTVYDWLHRFQDSNESLENLPRSGRPLEMDDDEVRGLGESKPRLTTREMAVNLVCFQRIGVNHLATIDKVPKLGTWVLHQLSARDRQQRIDLCIVHLTSHRTTVWLDSIISGNEK